MVQDARRFIFSSDNVVPNFVYKLEGNVANTAGTALGGCAKYQHNLPFTPIIVGVWSLSPDFSTSYTIGDPRYAQASGYGFSAFADSSYVYVRGSSSNSVARTFYFKIFSYVAPDYDGDVTPISDESKFHFSTDNNYLQIHEQGKVTFTDQQVVNIPHNLGYLPLFKVWETTNQDFWENGLKSIRGLAPIVTIVDPTVTNPNQNIADREKLIVTWADNRSPDANDYAYYQIYSNEA